MELTGKLKGLGQMTPGQPLEWASARLPPWISLLLVVVIAWQLADLVWSLWPGQNAATPVEQGPATAAPATAPRRAAVDASQIKGARLFGQFQATAQPVTQSEVADAPETRLRLTLKGTVADKRQSGGFAIIGEDGGDDKVYWIGDSIPGNATLHSIYADKVLLNRAGKLETLTLKTLLDKGATTTTSSRTASRPAPVRRPETGDLQALREKLTENPAQITEVIRPQPVFANGQQIGYRVYPGRDRQKFVQLGLRPGDLVTEINGSALNDPSQGQQIFQQLAESDVINLTIQRGGQSQTLTLRMDQ